MPKPKQWKTRALAAEAALNGRGYVVTIAQRKGPVGERIASTVLHLENGTPRATELDSLTMENGKLSRTRTKLEITVGSYYPERATCKEPDGDFLRRVGTDGAKWALEFAERFGGDPTPGGTLHGWFANAIEAGITEGESSQRRRWREQAGNLEGSLAALGDTYGRLSVVRDALAMWPDITEDGKLRLRPEPSRPLSADVAQAAAPHCSCDGDPIECSHEATREQLRSCLKAFDDLQAISGQYKAERDAARTQLAMLTEKHETVLRERDDARSAGMAYQRQYEQIKAERDEATAARHAEQGEVETHRRGYHEAREQIRRRDEDYARVVQQRNDLAQELEDKGRFIRAEAKAHTEELTKATGVGLAYRAERDETQRLLALQMTTLTGVLAENERLTNARSAMQATLDRERCEHAAVMTAGQEQVNNLVAENQRLRTANARQIEQMAERDQLAELQYRRMMQATARWRAEDPTNREGVLPDLGDLLSWLMAEADAAAQERDRAEAALSEYRGE